METQSVSGTSPRHLCRRQPLARQTAYEGHELSEKVRRAGWQMFGIARLWHIERVQKGTDMGKYKSNPYKETVSKSLCSVNSRWVALMIRYFFNDLEDPLIRKKVLRTGFGIRQLFSAQMQFEHFLRLPSCFAVVLERKRTRNSSAICRYSGAMVCNSGAIPNTMLCPPIRVFACVGTYLPQKLANICVSKGRRKCLFLSHALIFY